MIIETLANSAPYSYGSGNACKLLGPSLAEQPEPGEVGFCICDFVRCQFIEKVFASPGSTDYWKNDLDEFLFKRLVSADSVAIELHKDNVKVADLNNNALGTFFNGFPSGNAEQQLYVGYLLDWKLVEAAHGVGIYTVVADLNIIGVQSTFTSRVFNLAIYSDIAAHQTVVIETVQNGNIIGNQFDFTDLNWVGRVRIPGVFGNPTPVYEDTSYVTADRKKAQIQAKMSREWILSTNKLPWEIVEVLIYNKLMANEIKITDFNIFAENIKKPWRRVDVKTKEPEKVDTDGNPGKIYKITFVDAKDYFIKRNF